MKPLLAAVLMSAFGLLFLGAEIDQTEQRRARLMEELREGEPLSELIVLHRLALDSAARGYVLTKQRAPGVAVSERENLRAELGQLNALLLAIERDPTLGVDEARQQAVKGLEEAVYALAAYLDAVTKETTHGETD